ncbi:MAG: hypothetical protein AB1611_05020 [bacterium]
MYGNGNGKQPDGRISKDRRERKPQRHRDTEGTQELPGSMVFSLFVCLILSVALGCGGGPDLERIQSLPKVTLEGMFVTESPDEIRFPVKVLFAIDCSLSMGDTVNGQLVGSDPHFLRIEAVRTFVDTYNSNENTSFEIMLWNNDVFERTRTTDGRGGFTKDPDEINRVLNRVANDTMTDYLGTLEAIYADIERDINRVKAQEEQNLIRTKYIVVFLSDGMSNVQGGRQSDTDIWNRVNEMREMAAQMGVGSFNFHTFLLLGNFPPTADGQLARQMAETTLEGMADRGEGQFRLFENAEAIDFINIVDMRLTVEYKIKYLVAFNYNVRPGLELVYADSDADGLTDEEEAARGTDPGSRDTDADGLSDFFEVKSSSPGHELNPRLPDSPCDQMPDGIWPDSDNDGLTDCEEYVKGTNRHVADSDADGIPDGLEFPMGTNPLEDQSTADCDFDGVADYQEVQRHTNVTSNDPRIRERYSYQYDVRDQGLVPLSQGSSLPSYVRQYHFTISNIDLMDTLGCTTENGVALRPGDNLIRFYIAEVPEDNPSITPIFRMAEVVVNINEPNKHIILTPQDFVLLQ